MLDPQLLAILACPACSDRPPLRFEEEKNQLVCTKCGHIYKIEDGIPNLLVDEEKGDESHVGR